MRQPDPRRRGKECGRGRSWGGGEGGGGWGWEAGREGWVEGGGGGGTSSPSSVLPNAAVSAPTDGLH